MVVGMASQRNATLCKMALSHYREGTEVVLIGCITIIGDKLKKFLVWKKFNSYQFQNFERSFERVLAPLGAVVVVLLHRPEHVSDDRQNVGVQFAENAKEDSNPGQAKLAFSGARK